MKKFFCLFQSLSNPTTTQATRITKLKIEKQNQRAPMRFWNERNNRKNFFESEVRPRLRITRLDDFYNFNRKQVLEALKSEPARKENKEEEEESKKQEIKSRIKSFPSLLAHFYNDSFISALQDIYPEFEWLPWRFKGGVNRNYWEKKENRRKFMDWASNQLKIPSSPPEAFQKGWYEQKDRKALLSLGAKGLMMNYFDFSLIKALQDIYPEFEWLPWRFEGGVNRNYWEKKENRRKFMDWASNQLKIPSSPPEAFQEGWYKISLDNIEKFGGNGMIYKHYNHSLIECLKDIYPQFEWLPWKHGRVNRNFWTKRENLLEFLLWVEKQLGIDSSKDPSQLALWYNVNRSSIRALTPGKTSFPATVSLFEALRELHPEYEWEAWRFSAGVSPNFWKQRENRKAFFEKRIKPELKIESKEDWLRLKKKDLNRVGAKHLIDTYYSGSISAMLKDLETSD